MYVLGLSDRIPYTIRNVASIKFRNFKRPKLWNCLSFLYDKFPFMMPLKQKFKVYVMYYKLSINVY